jgi:hypothetical protein
MPRRIPNVGKINNLVGFSPAMNLDGILRTVIEYHTGQERRNDRAVAEPH